MRVGRRIHFFTAHFKHAGPGEDDEDGGQSQPDDDDDDDDDHEEADDEEAAEETWQCQAMPRAYGCASCQSET